MISLNPYSVGLLSVSAVMFGLAAHALRRPRARSVPGAPEFAVLTLGSGLWVGAHGLRIGATTREAYLLLVNLEWVGILLTAPAWLLFTLSYTGVQNRTPTLLRAFLVVHPIVTLALILMNPGGAFRVVESVTVTGPGLSRSAMSHGVLYWATVAYIYGLVVVGAAVLGRATFQVPQLYRGRTVALLVAVAAPFVGTIPTLLDISIVPGLNTGPVGFTVSMVALSVALFGHELLRVVPITPAVATNAVVSEMAAGVIVLDANGRITETNPAADRILDVDDPVGRSLRSVQPELAAATDGGDDTRTLLLTGDDDRQRHVAVESSPVYRGRGLFVGRLLTLHDVTDQVLREQRLNVLNRVLRHNVRHETNLILGHGQTIADSLSSDERENLEQMLSAAEQLVDWSNRARFAERALDGVDGERQQVPLGPAVEGAVARVRGAYPSVPIETPESVDTVVLAHSTLEWALFELVENAVVHGTLLDVTDGDSSVVVTIDSDDETVTVAVADAGPGIPAEERRVLDAAQETPLDHGSGLGLWLVNWTVKAAGGDVTFAENDPSGTVVRVTLPRVA